MSHDNWSDNVVLVSLPTGLEIFDEFRTIAEIVRERRDWDVAFDFSNVHFITSATIAKLLALRELLIECDHRLVLCNVSELIKGVFTVTAPNHAFEFADGTPVLLTQIHAQHY